MLKRLFVFLVISFYSVFASNYDFLEPEDAFKTKFEENTQEIIFTLNLGKDIYLYDDKLKVFISKPERIEITKELDIPKPVKYEEFIVHFDNQHIKIPKKLISSKVNSKSYEIEVHFQGCSKAGLCYAPMTQTYSSKITNNKNNIIPSKNKIVENNKDLNETDLITNTLKDGNIVFVLFTFFTFGLLLSFTPCVFPMIPILSSIIVKASNKEKLTAFRGFSLSLVYVLSMALAYTIAGVIAGLFGSNLQVMLQNPYVLVIFALIFVALALSMFGYYKLELPQSLQNKINKTTDGKEKQGVIGIAIMGFLSALIVGPCVAPPLAGALVYIGQTGDAILGGIALFVLSIGMGVPLLLIGLGAGKFMPKPGIWMDTITKLFGIVMLAIAIWMLDRVIPNYVIYLWAILLIATGVYLKQFEHIIIKTISILILVYGIVAFVGALSLAKNILNPLEKFISQKVATYEMSELSWKKVRNIEELNLSIKNSTKPVMLDFYADWCVACKEFEEITFKDKQVISKLKKFTLLKADVTKNTIDDKELQKKFGIFGPPGIIFWDKNANEIKKAKIIGYKNPKEFLENLEKNF
ncbi:thiol:disulfide interchange protein [Malaciobacter molluscorum LMG 25693]|uniref:Thiol:disulfide interchange protein n=1 Tax=Malaciobacter molluscorum LMG 25693 TaxID=870501 RepID=A0A2G1DEV6_9BACT|nr:protein-disulfide reductase DsbD [Malaciobacter molluscorum]AXX93509.1 thiol:disulfide interchange protein DsbD [Malaciobacter molluscorum LMG 25693]PHO16970.1 thiol:disulfide interchange protein [Malaciobacter molluscorum LMG 25693]